MFPSCPDNISPSSTCIRANHPGTEFDIPPEDRGWFDGGAIPPSGPYPSAGGIPPQQVPPNPGPQQPSAGPPNPLVVPPRPPVGLLFPGDEVNPSFQGAVPAGAPQPSIQPPAPGGCLRGLDDEAVAHLFRGMLVHGTNTDNQQCWGVDPIAGRAMDTPGYHPVNNPNPNPFSTYEPGMGGFLVPPPPAPFPIIANPQGL